MDETELILQYKQLLDKGIISQDEFNAEIARVINHAKETGSASANTPSDSGIVSYDVTIPDNHNTSVDIETRATKESEKKLSFFADIISDFITDSKNKEYDTQGYVIKLEKSPDWNTWKVYDNSGKVIYKVKKSFMNFLFPGFEIYDQREKKCVAEVQWEDTTWPLGDNRYSWVVQGKKLGNVTQKTSLKPLRTTYTAEINGWTYSVGLTKSFGILCGDEIIAKPLASRFTDPEPYEYYDLGNELGIVMMFYTALVSGNEEGASWSEQYY